jgi:hypothetical protein
MQSVMLVVPRRKTDLTDSQWLCQLLECWLLRGSFVPPKPIRELREPTRYRKSLIQAPQTLDNAGVKLACVATDVLGSPVG